MTTLKEITGKEADAVISPITKFAIKLERLPLILSFLIPFLYRFVLEAYWSPYPIGFDPMGVYIPFITGYTNINIYEMAPLYYMALQGLSTLLGDPFLSVKILAILLQGLLSLSLYLYSREKLKDPWRPLIFSLAVSFYFPVLRITWDLHRNVTGLTLLFFTLWLVEKNSTLSIPSAILSAIAHPTIPPLLIIALLPKLRRRNMVRLSVIIVATASIGLLLYMALYNLIPRTFVVGIESSQLVLYTIIPIFPFLALSLITLRRNLDFLLLSAATVTLACLETATNRFIILAPFFVTCMTAMGCLTLSEKKRYTALISITMLTIIGVFAVGYTLSPPQQPFNYFTLPFLWNSNFLKIIPSSLQQNTIPVNQADNLMSLLETAANKYGDAPLMTNQATLSYALLANFPKERLYYQGGPTQNPYYSNPKGLAVWFIPGKEWYGLKVENAYFRVLETKGDMALYGHIYTPYDIGQDQWKTWTLSDGYLLLNATTNVKGNILLSRLNSSDFDIQIRFKIDEVNSGSTTRIGIALTQPGWPPKDYYLIGLESNPQTNKAHAIIGLQKTGKWKLISSPPIETQFGEWIQIRINTSSTNTIQIQYNDNQPITLNTTEIQGSWQIAIVRYGQIKAYIDDRELITRIWGTNPQQN